MQLAPYNPNAQLAPWEQPYGYGQQGTALGAPASAGPQPTPLKKVHRLLRGRYALAIILALIGAAAGGAAGFLSQKPGYSSTGIISISGIIPTPDHRDVLIAMYGQHMAKQVAWLSSERLIKMAINRPDFKAVRQSNSPDPVKEFGDNLKVLYVKNTDQITVTYTDLDPAVAPLAVKAVIRTYEEHFKGRDLDYVNRKFEYWDRIKSDADKLIKSKLKEIEEYVAEGGWGTDNLERIIGEKQSAQMGYEAEVLRFRHQLETLKNGKAPDLTVDDIARIDAIMLAKVQARERYKTELAHARLTMLENHPTVVMLTKSLQANEQDIEQTAEEFRKKWVINNQLLPPVAGAGSQTPNAPAAVMPRDSALLELSLDVAERTAAQGKKETEKLGRLQRQIQQAKTVIADQNEVLKEAHAELEKLRFQKESIGDVTIISEGNSSAVAVDNRVKFGALGVLAGGGLPVALLLLIGLMDRRYRYSDEPGVDVSGITLLGILPNLPDRLSDPEQAAIAAHCVHQIRTMLQINGSTLGGASAGATEDERDRRVFAVTSANPGDGKTSLTLALGLSYAACGTRTLLIDCDLVGGGLTSRMNVNAVEGVLEAIADRSLLPYVRTTDIADVSILPVGSARGHHASTLSPGALRRLIDEAKKHFEVIMIDTGPILGSIEASLVCAAADGVVLTVARGQQRPMVEKALSHLAAIGARMAGVVFNRAQANDFERSISGMSIRSIARHPSASNGNGNGHGNGHANGKGYGPVAKAVVPGARD
jgi:capsular exopolysaccharide synthesis family protein